MSNPENKIHNGINRDENNTPNSHLPELLKQLRKSYKLTMEQVAAKIGIERLTTYSNYEYGRAKPSIDILVKLANLYGLTVEQLINNSPNQANQANHSKQLIQTNQQLATQNKTNETGDRQMTTDNENGNKLSNENKSNEELNISSRQHSISRKTGETNIQLEFQIDGSGQSDLQTDVPFLNHMLDLFAKHGQFDLKVQAQGDIEIDDHHTVEDIGICLGQAFREALGDKKGIKRYGNCFLPMDESLAQVVIDISNRPHFEYRAQYPSNLVGSFSTELVHEFLWKFALEARITLHVIVHYGQNTHHMIEAIFKGLARALDEATTIDPRVKGVPSSKGVL